MNKVIVSRDKEEIGVEDCKQDKVYLGYSAREGWGILSKEAYGSSVFKLLKMDNTITKANGYTTGDTGDIMEFINRYSTNPVDSWQFYQFPTFLEAMEYYVNECKK